MSIGVTIAVTVLLIAANAFFVAGEYSVTSSRRAQVEPLAAQGRRGARQALFALEHVSLMLAICQLGNTVASTTLGVVAEPAVASLAAPLVLRAGLPPAAAHAVGVLGALLIVVFLHVVFGETVPKNITMALSHRALLALAPTLVGLGRVLGPVVRGIDSLANWAVRASGRTPRNEVSAAFTADEVASILALSQRQGTIHDDLGLLRGSLEFSDATAGDAMVPLADLVVVRRGCSPADVEREVAKTGYSRYPVAGADGRVMGYLHVKDVLYAKGIARTRPVPAWRIREMESVGESDEVEDALRHMQKTGTHVAAVHGADGRMRGVLFLEDIIEELVGEVRDSLQRA